MECPYCKHLNRRGAERCALCRRTMPEDAVGSRQHDPGSGKEAERPGQSRRGTLRLSGECPQCGQINPARAAKCERCEFPLQRHHRETTGSRPAVNVGGTLEKGGRVSLRDRMISHYLVCPPLTPFRLPSEGRIVLGRGEKVDCILPGEMVSRSHAAVVGRDDRYFLEDLGSSNGTFRNGERVTSPTVLVDGDTISIGGFVIKYQVRQGRDVSESDAFGEVKDASTVHIDLHELARTLGALSGRLGEVSLPEVLQLLHHNKRTGTLKVTCESAEGSIAFNSGEIIDAFFKGTVGKDAVIGMASLTEGTFAFDVTHPEVDHRIQETTDHLMDQVIEALRTQQDEEPPGGSGSPP